jgi:hypothetical protein
MLIAKHASTAIAIRIVVITSNILKMSKSPGKLGSGKSLMKFPDSSLPNPDTVAFKHVAMRSSVNNSNG